MNAYKRNSFKEIVERIKDIISNDVNGFVLNKHVADVLKLEPNTIRVYKTRDILPCKHLLEFCYEYNISIDWLIFEKDIKIRKIDIDKI